MPKARRPPSLAPCSHTVAVTARRRSLRHAAQVREALGRKIARERVGVELAGALQGPNPALALRLVEELHIFPEVFRVPEGAAAAASLDGGHAATCVASAHAALDLLAARAFSVRAASRHALILGAPRGERAWRPGAFMCTRVRHHGVSIAGLAAEPSAQAVRHTTLRGAVQLENPETARAACAAWVLAPMRLLRAPRAGGKRGGGGSKVAGLPWEIVSSSLKWRTRDADAVALLHAELPRLCRLHDRAAGAYACEA